MIQILYALGALVAVTLFSFQQMQSVARAQLSMLEAEVTMQATGVATEVLEQIRGLSFDANLPAETPDALTRLPFRPAASWEAVEDLDDLHGLTWSRSVTTTADTLQFAVTAEVRYLGELNGAFSVSPIPTFYKEVVLTVEHAFLDRPVEIAQIYPYEVL